MNSSYDFDHWSRHHREKALKEAWERHLAKQARLSRKAHSGQSRMGLAWASLPSVPSRVELLK